MDAVIGRGVEDPVEDAELAHQLGVDPELIQGGDRVDRQNRFRPKADQRQRQHEQEVQRQDEQIEPYRHREIVLLRGVVRDVKRPHEAAAVPQAVEHVVDEVVDQHQQRPAIPGEAQVHRREPVQEGEQQQEHRLHGRRHEQVAKRQGEVRRGVPEFVGAQIAHPAQRGFDADEKEETGGDGSFQVHACETPDYAAAAAPGRTGDAAVVTGRYGSAPPPLRSINVPAGHGRPRCAGSGGGGAGRRSARDGTRWPGAGPAAPPRRVRPAGAPARAPRRPPPPPPGRG